MKLNFKEMFVFTKNTFEKWSDDKAPKLGAAMSFYTIFSIAPLLVISISVAGLIFGNDAAQGKIVGEIEGLVGRDGAQFIQSTIKNSSNAETGIIAGTMSLITLIIGSTAAFLELQDSLNIIWGVKPRPGLGIVKGFLKNRLISFAMVIGIGFLLLVSLIISAGLSALEDYIGKHLADFPVVLLQLLNLVISLGIIFILFAMIYKVLPDAHIEWSDVWVGAGITSALFVLGKFLIGLYLGKSSYSSTYGAAGSMVILIMWIYYSAQILYLGAEFTQVYANRYGSGITPASNAQTIENCDLDINLIKK